MRFLITAAMALVLLADSGLDPARAQDTTALSVPVARSFQDWRVACDNGGRCTAYTGNDGHAAGFVLITMPAGPDAAPEITVGIDPREDGPGPALRINGSAFPLVWSSPGTEDGLGRLAGDPARPLIAAMAAGRSMALAGGEEDVPVSLRGMRQALSWIDRRQGRNRTADALLLRGDRSAAAVPPAPVLPLVSAAPRVDQTGFGLGAPVPGSVDVMPQIRACRREWPGDARPELAVSARLGAATELWGPHCFVAAYNVGHRMYLSGPGGIDPRPLAAAGALEPTVDFVNAEYDPATRTLSNTVWGTSAGDSGRIQHWIWTGDRFALQSERAMQDRWRIPHAYWPTLWRSR